MSRTRALFLGLTLSSFSLPCFAQGKTPADSAAESAPSEASAGDIESASEGATKETQSPRPSEVARKEAAERFRRGVRFYEDSDYALALIEFERAYQLVPNYRVLYNIGQVAIQLSRFAHARRALTEYLDRGRAELSDERIAAVELDLEMLRARTAHLTVRTTQGAEVIVDDESRGVAPLSEPLLLSAGAHRVVVQKPGFEPANRRVTLAGADELELDIELVPRAPRVEPPVVVAQPVSAPAVVPIADTPEADQGPPYALIGWTATAAFGSAAVFTGIMGLSAKNELEELKSEPDPSKDQLDAKADQARGWFIATDVLAITTVVAAGASLYLSLSGSSSDDSMSGGRRAPSSPLVSDLRLRLSPQSAALTGRF